MVRLLWYHKRMSVQLETKNPAFVTKAIRMPAHCIADQTSAGKLKTLCKQGRLKEALHFLKILGHLTNSVYAFLLQACINYKAWPESKLVHAHIIITGHKPDVGLDNKLLRMYTKFRSLEDARHVFDKMPELNLLSWTAMMGAYSKNGQAREALTLFRRMLQTGINPDPFTFVSVLPACTALEALDYGRELHGCIVRSRFQYNVFVASTLVEMYSKCGRAEDARKVFNETPERDVVLWNTLIAGYAYYGHIEEALRIFQRMPKPNVISWNTLIFGCGQNGLVEEALKLFEKMPERDLFSWNAMIVGYVRNAHVDEALKLFHEMPQQDLVLWNQMIMGCAQNGRIDEAMKLFQKMPEKDLVSWNTMISGCVRNGHVEEALNFFCKMLQTHINPDTFTFASVLPACATLQALDFGKELQGYIVRSGFHNDVFVASTLVDMYFQCGRVEDAHKVFDSTPERDVVLWNALLAGYAYNGHIEESLRIFQTIPKPNVISWNTMIFWYGRNRQVEEAMKLFIKMPERDLFSWNAIISGYVQSGLVDEAMKLFQEMPHQDVVSWNQMIVGYAQNGRIDVAVKLFQIMPEKDLVSWSTMLSAYMQNSHVEEAINLFRKMPKLCVISWNSIIAGCTQNGNFNEALQLFQEMRMRGEKPNTVTFVGVLPACAKLAALKHGKAVHEDIIKNGFESDTTVGNALVDMYAKCGSIEDSGIVFEKMPARDVVSWNAMIVGYAMNGFGKEALQLFKKMEYSGMKPNDITFIGILSACCNAGLLDDGWQYFNSMNENYDVTPAIEHYCCMVDLLGRTGHLYEAYNFISTMPIKPDAAVWASLLSACRIHSSLELGEHVAEFLFLLDSKHPGHYVLLSNMYAAAGRWDDVEKVRKMMKEMDVKKTPGSSWIDF